MLNMKTLGAVLVALLMSACGGGGGSEPSKELGSAAPPLSIVVIGDSIASGEGINYGYQYDTSFPNHWYGGITNPQWQGDYQLCHDSDKAYGDVLAPMIQATLTKFACTGSTYDNGITFDRRYDGALYRPAQLVRKPIEQNQGWRGVSSAYLPHRLIFAAYGKNTRCASGVMR